MRQTMTLGKRFLGAATAATMALSLSAALAVGQAYAEDTTPAYTYSLNSYNEDSATVDGSNMQHVKLVVDYTKDVQVNPRVNVMDGLTIEIAGYDIESDSYYRPVEASVEDGNLVLDIGNVQSVVRDESGAIVSTTPAFTAIYGGVIDVNGTPTGVSYVDGAAADALDIYTVIPTGVTAEMTAGEGSSTLSATVTHASNVRAMVHYAIYDASSGEMTPVHTGGTTAGNLGIGDQVTHAHMFMSMTPAQIASGIASGASLPAGYSITANGADLTVAGPEGSELYLYILDDATFQANGQTFDGIVSNDGVWTEYLPDAR